jgi:hypothetical protein
MIKFFRKIRQKLLSENKTGKYLKYAFGEIILVVIGIIIALQVNEWNNERNKNKAEEIVLEQFKSDLLKSQKELKEIKIYYYERTKACAIVLRAFWKTETLNDSIEKNLELPNSIKIYSPILGTARSLINSGSIELLRSPELKNEIVSYVEKVDDKLIHIKRHEESYFRKGRGITLEIMPNNFISKESYNKMIEETPPEVLKEFFANDFNSMPRDYNKIPFQPDLNELLKSEKIYKAYINLNIAHYQLYKTYDEILFLTDELLNKLNNTVLIDKK